MEETHTAIAEKKKKFSIKWKSKEILFAAGIILVLAAILFTSVWVRTQNIPQLKDVTTGNYTLGPDLDPFLYLRNANEIVSGNMQNPDIMRQAPLGTGNYAKTNMMPWIIVGVYKIFHLGSVEFAAIITPVILFALTLIVFFLFIRKVFSKISGGKSASIIALIASAFYAFAPEMLHRTTAGIPEIESIGMLWFWCAFYFFVAAWQSDKIKKQIINAALAGISTGLMMFSWGGYSYIFMAFALASFIIFFFGKEKMKNAIIYSSWIIPSLIIFMMKGASISGMIMGIRDTGFALMVFAAIIIGLALSNEKLKKIREKIKLPESAISVIVLLVLGLLAVLIVNPGIIPSTFSKIIDSMLHPFGEGRIGLTVAENRAPYITEVLGSFGWIFWAFFLGTIMMFYEATKHFEGNRKLMLNSFFLIFLITFIFSRISSQSMLNGDNFISKFLYFGGLAAFCIAMFCIYLNAHRKKDEKTLNDFRKIKFEYILLLALSFWGVVSMRGAVRLFFIISPILIIVASYLPVKIAEYGFNTKEILQKILVWCVVLLLAISLIITFIKYEKSVASEAKWTIPSAYYQQWMKAMQWTRENTPENSTFVHWWDYGYWVQTWGERPTVTDGGHVNAFWDHTTARYLMTAQDEKTALQLCKAYNVSYFLIDSSDVGKYPAYSSIGSDATGNDRLSWIGTFLLDDKRTEELKNETRYTYIGGTMLDEDVLWNGQLFPANRAGIGAFILSIDAETQAINGIDAIMIYNGKQISIPIKYAYINGKLADISNGKESLDSAFYLFPRITPEGSLQNIGAGMYLSTKAMNAEWVRLYLLGETENFELVHAEPALFVQQLKDVYNLSVGDFVYANDFYGPIKIFKANYPDSIPYYKEYLQTTGWSQNTGPFASLDSLGV